MLFQRKGAGLGTEETELEVGEAGLGRKRPRYLEKETFFRYLPHADAFPNYFSS